MSPGRPSLHAILRRTAVSLFAAALMACASGSRTVNLREARRVVGTENDVRIDAEVYGDALSPSSVVGLRYDITNGRRSAIAIADLIPLSSYDPETGIVTVSIGSEVPGEALLPRLLPIAGGEKKSFSTEARVRVIVPGGSLFGPVPHALQLRVNFLGDTKPFAQLLSIPERAVYDPGLAAELFPAWVERNEVVTTNTLPMKWSPQKSHAVDASVTPSSFGGRRP